MSIMTLKLHADEGGTYTICIACTNDAGGADTPQTLNWTLTDSAGDVINSRKEVDIPGPVAEEEVKLTGDDLAMQVGEIASEVSRIFTTKGTDSNGDPIRGRNKFILDNYVVLPIV